MSFSERDCDAMDHAREQQKERDHETRCRLNVKAPSGVLIGCGRDAGHSGACVTRSGIKAEVPPEPAVVRIAKALVALVAPLPDVKLVTVHTTGGAISIDCKTDDGVRALAGALGTEAREHDFDGHRWLSTGHYGDVRIYIAGPHHEVVAPAPIDETTVTAALSQADAALDTNAERHALAHANGEI